MSNVLCLSVHCVIDSVVPGHKEIDASSHIDLWSSPSSNPHIPAEVVIEEDYMSLSEKKINFPMLFSCHHQGSTS